MAVQPIHRALVARLSGFAGLSALVSDRIQPFNESGTTTAPYVTYQLIDTPRERTMGPTYGLATARFQLNAWADTYNGAYDVAAQLHAALRGFSGTEASVVILDSNPVDEDDVFDERGELHGRRVDYEITYREA